MDEKAPANVDKTEAAVSTGNLLNLEFSQIKGLAQVMASSGLFKDVRSANQAFVQILAGQEMGIPPFQAMSDIHILQGKATAGANIYASKIKASHKYDYHVRNWTDRGCAIEFYEIVAGKRVLLGVSQFDENNAKKAGLLGKDNWTKYARNMYFARAITNGVRTYCPDVLGGITAYTPEELGDRTFIEAEEFEHNETITEEVQDPTLLEQDKNPDTPPEQLDYDREEQMPDNFLQQDDVAEVTDEELDNPTVPDLPEAKGKK